MLEIGCATIVRCVLSPLLRSNFFTHEIEESYLIPNSFPLDRWTYAIYICRLWISRVWRNCNPKYALPSGDECITKLTCLDNYKFMYGTWVLGERASSYLTPNWPVPLLLFCSSLIGRNGIGSRICHKRIRSNGGTTRRLSTCELFHSCDDHPQRTLRRTRSYEEYPSILGSIKRILELTRWRWRQIEHIDNPKGYGEGEDARRYHPKLRGPVDVRDISYMLYIDFIIWRGTKQPRELEIDPHTGMKNYIANGKSNRSISSPFYLTRYIWWSETGNWETSKALVRRLLEQCINLGRQHRSQGRKQDEYEAYRLLGTAVCVWIQFHLNNSY